MGSRAEQKGTYATQREQLGMTLSQRCFCCLQLRHAPGANASGKLTIVMWLYLLSSDSDGQPQADDVAIVRGAA